MSVLPVLPEPGHLVAGKYRLVRRIGDGGMASVFSAQHQRLGIPVALKFLHPRLHRHPALVERFLQEARMVARVRSPHVVQVLDVDQDAQGLAFLVLELVEGSTLRALQDRAPERRLAPALALRFALQLCEGLEAVHRAGIVHRDLKPDNLMISADPSGLPRLSLLDFGIALPEQPMGQGRAGQEGAVLGTPEYMAPEQLVAADSVDLRADLFSAGVLVYEMLSGRLPAAGEAPRIIAARHLEGRIPRLELLVPGLAAEVAAAIHRAMAPAPDQRFASAAALRAALEPWVPMASAEPSPTPAPVSLGLAADPAAGVTAIPDPGESIPTTVEAPWFEIEPTPSAAPAPTSPSATPAPCSAGVLAGLPPRSAAPTSPRRRPLAAATLALLAASLLGLATLAPHLRKGLAAPVQPGLAEALLAAPLTEVEADPPAPPAVPEVTPAPSASPTPRPAALPPAPAPRPAASVPARLPPATPPPPPAVLAPPKPLEPPTPPTPAPPASTQSPPPPRPVVADPLPPPRERRRAPPRVVYLPPPPPPRPPEGPVFATPPPPRIYFPVDPSPPARRVIRVVPRVPIYR